MFEYYGHVVRFEWQSKQSAAASVRVCELSHAGSRTVAGL